MAASQRVQSRVPAPHRSILPSVPGIPAGAAVLIAVACTFLGFLIDASGEGGELTGTFATLYVVGCVIAALAVRYRGLFTTMVLPPLLLFVSVPLAYQQLTGRESTSIKDILLNLAIPLVNRFPTMAIATLLVLAIGAGRILLHRREATSGRTDEARRGTSWGRSAAKRSRTGTSAGTLAESARRRLARAELDDLDDLDDVDDVDEDEASPRIRRRGPVADTPPRLAATAEEPGADDRPTAKYPRGTRGPARPTAAMPRAGAEPNRRSGARGRAELPPHPQPNVRYRERDSSRNERRKPENL
ncbi:DUF6542 domain-containing protein [Nocardia sp. NPDC051463]|uniref:DUF6542 domain-containing protein n=1 Tax=Nocardia sp. NPDC051463 TaxID=3154845 RepID=UPI00344F89E0